MIAATDLGEKDPKVTFVYCKFCAGLGRVEILAPPMEGEKKDEQPR